MILDVKHGPTLPKPTDQVTITARIVDEGTPAATPTNVTVHYRVDSLDPGPFLQRQMTDSGIAGDAVANDGIWTAVLPAQADKAIVESFSPPATARTPAPTPPTRTPPSRRLICSTRSTARPTPAASRSTA